MKEPGLTFSQRLTFNEWRQLVNMTQGELDAWSANPLRLAASLSASRARAAGVYSGHRSLANIRARRSRPPSTWTPQDFAAARREVSFIKRMLGVSPGKPAAGGMSKWEISLRNWGHDPRKRTSPAYAKLRAWRLAHGA